MKTWTWTTTRATAALLLICHLARGDATAPATAPAAEPGVVALDAATDARLGLALAPAEAAPAIAMRTVPGEVLAAAPAGALPVTATTDLVQLAALQARADADLARTAAEQALAEANDRRARALVEAEAGSLRARDEAIAALAAAQAAWQLAREQRRQLGPAVGRLASSPLWVRAMVPVADLGRIDRRQPARVRRLGSDETVFAAPVADGPATANPASTRVDLWYALPAGAAPRFGERVRVDLPEPDRDGDRARPAAVAVPASALVVDADGGRWLYVERAPHRYARQRVEVLRIDGGQALLSRGPEAGRRIVITGAAELYGVEFEGR